MGEGDFTVPFVTWEEKLKKDKDKRDKREKKDQKDKRDKNNGTKETKKWKNKSLNSQTVKIQVHVQWVQ